MLSSLGRIAPPIDPNPIDDNSDSASELESIIVDPSPAYAPHQRGPPSQVPSQHSAYSLHMPGTFKQPSRKRRQNAISKDLTEDIVSADSRIEALRNAIRRKQQEKDLQKRIQEEKELQIQLAEMD